jgi:tRNA(Ile)-lysidine synthase
VPKNQKETLVSKTTSSRVFALFRQEVIARKLVEPGDHILLAYSGGPDSTCLLSLLQALREEIPFSLSLAHLNHGLRPAAAEDEAFVRQMAQRFSLPLVIRRVKVRSYARRHRLNLEEAGRQLRYTFLEETRQKLRATKIATGHTMDDQAETFLLRLFRGSGPRGLAGIYPQTETKVIRPLLGLRRHQVETYLKETGLPFCLDESNLDRRYRRNRLRLELIPLLEKRFDPKVVDHLARAADILRAEEEFLNQIEEQEAARVMREEGEVVLLDSQALSELHLALARRLVRRFLAKLRGDLREVNFREVEAIRRLEPGQEIHLRRRIKLVRLGSHILEKKTLNQWRRYQLLWDGKGVVTIPGLGLKFSGRIVKGSELPPFNDTERACLRADLLRWPLLLRPRQPGDSYQPFGATKPRKLKEIMSDRRLPASLRPFLPVFLSGKHIIWVPGCPVAEAFKVSLADDEVFIIEKI